MSKKETPGMEDDWARVASNPDNVIISESLISRVDPYNLGTIENKKKVTTECEFKFEDYFLTGDVVGFSRVNGTTTYTFETTPAQACQLMNESTLQSFAVMVGDEVSVSVDDATSLGSFNFEVDVQNSTSATVAVSFTEVSQ